MKYTYCYLNIFTIEQDNFEFVFTYIKKYILYNLLLCILTDPLIYPFLMCIFNCRNIELLYLYLSKIIGFFLFYFLQ